MAKGSESSRVDAAVSSIRAGMKREFLAMMKSQEGFGISVGSRRVTRSQNGSLRSGLLRSPVKDGGLEVKRRRKVAKRVEVEMVEGKESGDGGNVVVVSEDDEPKSDVLDGSLEEDEKVEVVEVAKGDDWGLVKCENVVGKAWAGGGIERNNLETESSVGGTNVEVDSIDRKALETEMCSLENDVQELGDYVKNEVDIANAMVKESVVENVEVVDNCATPNDDRNIAAADGVCKELHELIGSQEKVLKGSFNSGKGVEAVPVSAEESGEVGVPDKPVRRFTRSSLKQKDLNPETSGGEDVKDVKPLEKDHVSAMIIPEITDSSERPSICVSGAKSCAQMTSSIAQSKSKGRLTRKDLRMHKIVFEDDVLPDGTEVAYYSHGMKMLEGYKKGFGIFCYCCQSEVSPSVFETHAGYGSRRKPYLNIYISNGVSLHELSVRLVKERKTSVAENDDLCSICADGGDLLCCDSCPRAFHADCVSLTDLPQGAWHCRYCENTFLRDKFVEHNANAIAAGRVLGVDPLDQLMTRCIRIVENLEADSSSCVLCRGKDFSKFGFGPQTVIICDQCEKEYHVGCLKEHNMDHLTELPEGKWFCCVECDKVHTALEKVVADGEKQVTEFLLAMIKEKHANLESNDRSNLDVRWRLLHGKLANEETRKLLSGAVTIFHERFDPIADSTASHRLDLIPQMVYGRDFKDQDLGGMYTAVLTVNSMVVCAGIIRIFGQAIAELPLVATSTEHQGQGYFQCLFSCIEDLLASLGVKDLLLPAAEEAESLWINKIGFKKITRDEMQDYRKDHQIMIFQGTSMLHKTVQKSSEEFILSC